MSGRAARSRPRVKRTVAWPRSPHTEEDHDPSVPAHTARRRPGLRHQPL